MTPPNDLKGLINIFIDIINPLIFVLAGLSLFIFFKGLLSFIIDSDDTKKLEEGKDLMKWGLLGLFIMLSLWGILSFFSGSFGFGSLFFPLLPGSPNN